MKNITRTLILFATGVFAAMVPQNPLYAAKYMRVYYVDWNAVSSDSNGDSVLIEMPGVDGILGTSDDKNMVIDGGSYNDKSKTRWDEFLAAKNISTINYMFLSHPHSDHLTGLLLIANLAKVDYLYANRDHSEVYNFYSLKYGISSAVYVNPGDILSSTFTASYSINTHPFNGPSPNGWDPNVSAKVVAANETQLDSYTGDQDYNAQSVIFTLRFGSSSFLFGGDSKRDGTTPDIYGEGYAIANHPGEQLKVDIFKADHHGDYNTYTSRWFYNSINFLNLVMPKWCVSQDGGQPDLPHIQTLENLKSRGAKIYRNDLDGHILVKCDDAGNYDIVRETVRYDDDRNNNKVSGSGLSNLPVLPNDLKFYQTFQSSVMLSWSAVARHLGCIVNYDVYMATCSNGDGGAGIGAAGGFTPTQKAEPYLTGIYQKVNSTDIAGKEPAENMYYTVTGLERGATNYFFRVASVGTNYYYEHRYSNEADGVPPGKIIAISAAPKIDVAGSITLTWTVPGGNGYSDYFNGYFYVQNTRSAADAANASFWNLLLYQNVSGEAKDLSPGANYSMTLYGLTPGTTYYMRVWSKDQSFNYSAMSAIITAYASPPTQLSSVYVFPNPVSTGSSKFLTFKNLTAYAKIDIFNIAGELVFEMEKNDFTDEFKWDLSNNSGNPAASGTYIYAVTDSSGRQKTGKFLVIR